MCFMIFSYLMRHRNSYVNQENSLKKGDKYKNKCDKVCSETNLIQRPNTIQVIIIGYRMAFANEQKSYKTRIFVNKYNEDI